MKLEYGKKKSNKKTYNINQINVYAILKNLKQ